MGGSTHLAKSETPGAVLNLESVGYYRSAPGSQRMPTGLGMVAPSWPTRSRPEDPQQASPWWYTGRNPRAWRRRGRPPRRRLACRPLCTGTTGTPGLGTGSSGWSTSGSNLDRSDHAPFWNAGVPSVVVSEHRPAAEPELPPTKPTSQSHLTAVTGNTACFGRGVARERLERHHPAVSLRSQLEALTTLAEFPSSGVLISLDEVQGSTITDLRVIAQAVQYGVLGRTRRRVRLLRTPLRCQPPAQRRHHRRPPRRRRQLRQPVPPAATRRRAHHPRPGTGTSPSPCPSCVNTFAASQISRPAAARNQP